MSIAFDHRDPGTDEQRWADAAPWAAAPELTLTADRLVVLAAHPDDETLGAGGLITVAAQRGVPVEVVCASDGEAAGAGGTRDPQLAMTRRAETARAVALLAPDARVTFLGLPDGGLRENADALRRAVAATLQSGAGSTLVVAPWVGDGHRDHRVLGDIAAGFRSAAVEVLGYPVWLWHWGEPAEVDTTGWRVLPLSAATAAVKARAIACHATQLTPPPASPGEPPMLSSSMLRHFQRPLEVFVTSADERADAVGIAYFHDLYARHEDPWGYDSRWYEQRKREIVMASLPRPRFRRALDVACSTGALTAALRDRADRVVATDAVPTALDRARARIGDDPRVSFQNLTVPAEWPDGSFDLIVLSEVGYYLSRPELERVIDRIDGALTDDGMLVACHWRHPISGAPLGGDEVHDAIRARRTWETAASHLEPDFRLDVLARPGSPSVAAREGLTP
ncbi:bifunctional PIG-L family deacetylase/class I SAM-dependent methyltransferase [Microbacterium terricola]|uniref:Methyltransferase domain-containing protein n=1 Tax=Microbacterium terricola TaxID=344163 RepID=A0ABM8DVM3_9MICO|nr:bifunctional PIG-L family deacetylase/class I SAM-dependent methyltransferase [Microbacterium terricola]UYK39642.1 bifunctional PIG-L family deacetylase/class I SAM-dependent methyltransferase [Microbacterium terricola]BDV29617.1 hypothetical protein Microterr_02770 [Microbacterium terricola]